MKLNRILASALLAGLLAVSPLALAACSSSSTEQTTTQDDCYGDDLPVVNNVDNAE